MRRLHTINLGRIHARRLPRGAALVAAAMLLPVAAQLCAQTYPVKPIRYIVPFAPAGTGDVCARFHAQKMQERMGQPVVIENRAGANQAIGIEAAAKAPGDGYTVLQGALSGIVMNTIFANVGGQKLPYDVQRDLTPVSMVCTSPLYLGVHVSVGAKTIKEVIAVAKAKPGKLTYSSNGVGGTQHLAVALFAHRMGLNTVHVPYKSGAQSTTDVVTGVIDMLFGGSLLLPHARAGKVHIVAVGHLKRAGATPDVPTMHEQGVTGFDVISWFALMAPTATPKAIIDRLHRETEAILRPGAARDGIANNDVELIASTPAELGERIRGDFQVWEKTIRETGIKLE
jgi:tripartite-type tricarboxylate transporter receptor subunit TctC